MFDDSHHLSGPLFASLSAMPLRGRVRVPGDKSISLRALMLGGLAIGQTRISGLLEGEDVLATAAAMRALGASVERQADGSWLVNALVLVDWQSLAMCWTWEMPVRALAS